MTRRSSTNPTVPRDPKDKRTQPRTTTDPLKPRKTKKQILQETDPAKMSAPEFEKYQAKLSQKARVAGRNTRVAQRSQAPTRKLPPLCASPLDKPTRAGSEQDRLTPKEITLYGIQDTYLTICTRYAGADTNHPGTGYCADCEERARRSLGGVQTASGKTRKPTARQTRIMTQKQLAEFHGTVMRNRDVLGQRMDIGPHEALLDEVQFTAGNIEYLRGLMQDLGRAKEEGQEHLVLLQMSKMGMEPSALMQIYQWERNHLINASRAAIACGVAERKVKLAEDQGKLLVMVLQAFMYDPALGLSPGQLMVAPDLIRKHLLAIPQETNPHGYLDRLATGTLPDEDDTTEIVDVESKEL